MRTPPLYSAAQARKQLEEGRLGKARARSILHERLRQTENKYVAPYMIAAVYAGLERKDEAFEYLEKAYQERSPDLTYFLRTDLRVDSLRADSRFDDLVRRIYPAEYRESILPQ